MPFVFIELRRGVAQRSRAGGRFAKLRMARCDGGMRAVQLVRDRGQRRLRRRGPAARRRRTLIASSGRLTAPLRDINLALDASQMIATATCSCALDNVVIDGHFR